MDEWFGCKDILAQGWGKTPLWWGGGVAGILCFKVGSKKFLCFKEGGLTSAEARAKNFFSRVLSKIKISPSSEGVMTSYFTRFRNGIDIFKKTKISRGSHHIMVF